MAAAAAGMARKLLSPSHSAARLLLSRHLSSTLLHGGRAPAAMDLLRPAALASSSLLVRLIGGARGMARRPGGDGYSPAHSQSVGGDRAPTEMAPLFPGCDYEHWLIVMDKPGGEGATKQQMIDCYIQTLAKVLGGCAPLPASDDLPSFLWQHSQQHA